MLDFVVQYFPKFVSVFVVKHVSYLQINFYAGQVSYLIPCDFYNL